MYRWTAQPRDEAGAFADWAWRWMRRCDKKTGSLVNLDRFAWDYFFELGQFFLGKPCAGSYTAAVQGTSSLHMQQSRNGRADG
jgi:hypothetical protein